MLSWYTSSILLFLSISCSAVVYTTYTLREKTKVPQTKGKGKTTSSTQDDVALHQTNGASRQEQKIRRDTHLGTEIHISETESYSNSTKQREKRGGTHRISTNPKSNSVVGIQIELKVTEFEFYYNMVLEIP